MKRNCGNPLCINKDCDECFRIAHDNWYTKNKNMIDTNELMLGNYVYHDPTEWNYAGHKEIFEWSDSDWHALAVSTLFIENISPIPLTEEWLEKFGFDVSPAWKVLRFTCGQGDVTEFHYSNGALLIEQYSESTNNMEGRNWCADAGIHKICTRDVKYVHELQNLFYSLTGDQLKTK